MKRITPALILLLFLRGAASADLGEPTIQAVCRIKLTDGRLIEGFITVAAGGYEGTHPSGFRFESGSQQVTHFLSMDFKKLVRDSAGNYKVVFNDGRVISERASGKPSKIVFLEWQREIVNNRAYEQYKELDALTIVTELPYILYIDPKYEGLQNGSVVTIPLNRIVTFELIDRPSKKWLDHIKERREVDSEVDADAEDWTEPDWYHELRRHKEWVPIQYSPPKYQAQEQDLSPLVRQLKDQNHGSFLRIRAARSLRDLGPKAKPAIASLIGALNDQEYAVEFFAAKALVKLAPASVAGLAEALKNENEKVRTAAARLLGEIGPSAGSAAIPVLIEALQDQNNIVRRNTAYVLVDLAYGVVELRPLTQAAIPALIDLLKDQDVPVRKAAAFALGAISTEARASVPALIEALKDSDASVRVCVAEALLRIEPDAKEAVNALIAALRDGDPSVRSSAAHAFAVTKQEANEAVNALIIALKDRDASVLQSAVNALGNIGEAALPGLSDALKDQDKAVRDGAARAFTFMGARQKAAVPVLIEALRNEDTFVRLSAVNLLAGFGSKATAAAPSVIAALNDAKRDVRTAAANALVAIGADASAAVPVLIEALNDDDEQVRLTARSSLSMIDAQLATILVQISETSPEGLQIIDQIKELKPEVDGQPSVLALGQAVKDESRKKGSDGLRPIGWEASQKTNGRWHVVLHYRDNRAQYQKAEWEYDPESNRIYAFERQNAPRFWMANSFLRKAASRPGILIIVCSSIGLGCAVLIIFRKSLRRLLDRDQTHQT